MGAIKLSNAVRAAQTKEEEGRRVLGSKGVVGIAKREEKGMIWAPHMGFGTGTNSKKCYIKRNQAFQWVNPGSKKADPTRPKPSEC